MNKRLILLLTAAVFLLGSCARPNVDLPQITTGASDPQTTDVPAAAPITDPAISGIETPPVETEAPEPITYTDISLLNAGDIMFHGRNVAAGYDSASGSYSFDEVFQYLRPIVEQYDYAVANLETTFSGKESGYTSTYSISFNTPDEGMDAIRNAGFDLMLFANNHTNDRGLAGIKRTVSVVRDRGLSLIGASDDPNDDFWKVVDVNGVRLGMLNYTNDGSWGTTADGTLNGTSLGASADYLNVFYLGKLDQFYEKVERDIQAVKAAGADLVICYIHWGPEYFTEPQAVTKQIAQKLCDLGVDAIIGGHPHVVQPMETLTSTTDPSRRTLCFYSLGNLISNQNRKSLTTADCYGNDSANTENGLLVALTIRKYSTGQTLITGAEIIPTWVHRYDDRTTWKREYRIIPLERALADPDAFGLYDSSFGVEHATASLAYTKAMLEEGVAAFNQSVTLPAGTENAYSTE